MSEANKAVVVRFYEELWNNRDLDIADEIFAADCVTHQLRSGDKVASGEPRGPESVKEHVTDWLSGFPDLKFEVEQILSDSDLVMSRSVMNAAHTGEWLGIPPTNKPVSIRMSVVHRISDGKIVEDWVLVEALGFFQQLGLVPDTQALLAEGLEPEDQS